MSEDNDDEKSNFKTKEEFLAEIKKLEESIEEARTLKVNTFFRELLLKEKKDQLASRYPAQEDEKRQEEVDDDETFKENEDEDERK